jgi:hypothetical protein
MYMLGPCTRVFSTWFQDRFLCLCAASFTRRAYSVIIGKHFSNFDASDFRLAIFVKKKGKASCIGMNLFKVGTKRDAEKWPLRDRRKDADKLDLIISICLILT